MMLQRPVFVLFTFAHANASYTESLEVTTCKSNVTKFNCTHICDGYDSISTVYRKVVKYKVVQI